MAAAMSNPMPESLLQALVGPSLLDQDVQVGEEGLAGLLGPAESGGAVGEVLQPI